jgi:hypothetical protein
MRIIPFGRKALAQCFLAVLSSALLITNNRLKIANKKLMREITPKIKKILFDLSIYPPKNWGGPKSAPIELTKSRLTSSPHS